MTANVTQPVQNSVIVVDGERTPVERECFATNDGHWYCVTHGGHFGNNLLAYAHENDGQPHEAAWLCDRHGAEGVPA